METVTVSTDMASLMATSGSPGSEHAVSRLMATMQQKIKKRFIDLLMGVPFLRA
jgi:hypothetical protein